MTKMHQFESPGCPARAGIGPNRRLPMPMLNRLPRASGDRPFGTGLGSTLAKVAPRERG